MSVEVRSSWTADRWIPIAAVSVLGLLSWIYLWLVPMPMPASSRNFSWMFALLTFLMWFVMMIAMMAPAVLQVVLLFQRVVQRSTFPQTRTALFAAGYFIAWGMFSIAATAMQLLLMHIDWVDTMGVSRKNQISAGFMAIIGIYQWLPVKSTCLQHCRSPVDFITRNCKPSVFGAGEMGLHHGLYCIGCCWLLMLLLFVGGVMNLLWVAGITLIVIAERLFSRGLVLQRAIGTSLIIAAVVMAARPWEA